MPQLYKEEIMGFTRSSFDAPIPCVSLKRLAAGSEKTKII